MKAAVVAAMGELHALGNNFLQRTTIAEEMTRFCKWDYVKLFSF